jgi:hypothetical protein
MKTEREAQRWMRCHYSQSRSCTVKKHWHH